MKTRTLVGAVAAAVSLLLLSGCAGMGCLVYCARQEHHSSSLVQFLYPQGAALPAVTSTPQLQLPLRVGLAFLPSDGAQSGGGLDAAHRQLLLERIRGHFLSRKFIAEITSIPDYYLATTQGYLGLEGVQRLYGLDLLALISYDQVAHTDDNKLSLGYLTIVGAYALKGTRHDVSTLVDLAVVDPVSRSLVLRAGGVDTRRLITTLIDAGREQRETRVAGFDAAARMVDNFDLALQAFETEVREGRARVQVTHAGGGGSLDMWLLVLLAVGVMLQAAAQRSDWWQDGFGPVYLRWRIQSNRKGGLAWRTSTKVDVNITTPGPTGIR